MLVPQAVTERKSVVGSSYLESRCQHTCRDHQIRQREAGHAERQENWLASVCKVVTWSALGLPAYVSGASVVIRTRMERSVHNLLCFPQFRSHGRDCALLVRDHQFLCLLKTIFTSKKGPADNRNDQPGPSAALSNGYSQPALPRTPL